MIEDLTTLNNGLKVGLSKDWIRLGLVALSTIAMLLWRCGYICIFLCLVVTLRPRLHSDCLASSATALSKRLTMHTNSGLPSVMMGISCSNWWASPPGLRNDTLEQQGHGGQLTLGFAPCTAIIKKILLFVCLMPGERRGWGNALFLHCQNWFAGCCCCC